MQNQDGNHVFQDALTRCAVRVDNDGCRLDAGGVPETMQACTSLFFPGCSFLNFAPQVLQKTYALLKDLGVVEGISFLCCGKLLAFEPDAECVVPAFEQQMASALVEAGVQRIVAACPNCVAMLRDIIARQLPDTTIQVVALPHALVEAGFSIERSTVEAVVGAGTVFAVHDSCPDRTTGEFSSSVRALLPSDMLVETRHNRATSFCCGALMRAEGRDDAAVKASQKHGQEACEAGAQSLITYCISCAQQLSRCQEDVPVHHYLELLFECTVNWNEVGGYMTTRFLFEEAHGTRDYAGMNLGDTQ